MPSAPETKPSWDPELDDPQAPIIPIRDRVGIMGEFWTFLWENKIWWLAPTVLVLAVLALVLFLAGGSVVAPFFYALV